MVKEILFLQIHLENNNTDWRLVLDWPFDDEGYGPKDDLAKIEEFKETNIEGTNTIVIIPSFLSNNALKELGTLVILDHILNNNRFPQYATNLSAADQHTAKTILDNQRSQLHQRMINYLEGAYGVRKAIANSLDTMHEIDDESEHFISLDNGLQLRPPAANNMKTAIEGVLFQALEYQYPAHPAFHEETRLTTGYLNKIYVEICKAALTTDCRQSIDKTLRKDFKYIAEPLKLGIMGETHFVLDNHWKDHFLRKEVELDCETTVKKLRAWIDEPHKMGLDRSLQDLIIMTFACQNNRTFFHFNAQVEPVIGKLADEVELRTVDLPSEEEWQTAIELAAKLFGITSSSLLNSVNLKMLKDSIDQIIASYQSGVTSYLQSLKQAIAKLSLKKGEAIRLVSVESAFEIFAKLKKDGQKNITKTLVNWENQSTDTAVATSIKNSVELDKAINTINWQIFDGLSKLTGSALTNGNDLIDNVKKALLADEHVIQLKPAIEDFNCKGMNLIMGAIPGNKKDETSPDKEQTKTSPGTETKVLDSGNYETDLNGLDNTFKEISEKMKTVSGAKIRLNWEIYE